MKEKNNGKKIKSGRFGKLALVAGAAFAATAGGMAHADEVLDKGETAKPVSESKSISQADVQAAIEEATVSQARVDQQASQVEKANSDLETAKEELSQAQAALVDTENKLGQTSPEDVATLSKNLASQEKEAASLKKDVETTKEQYQELQKQVTQETSILKKKEEEELAVQAEINQAKGQLKQSQIAVSDKAVKDAEKKVQAADEKVNKQQEKVKQAQVQLKQAQVDDQKQASYVETISKAKDAAALNVKKAQEAVNKEAQQSQAYKTVNHIKLDASYVSSLKQYASSVGAKSNFNASGLLVKNKYKAEKGDDRKVGSWGSLSPEIREELNAFAGSLINEVRQSFGYAPAKVTQGMVQFATDVANNYEKRNQAGFHGHETDSIRRAAEKNGLKTNSRAGNLGYEDLNMYAYNVSTVGGLKSAIYGSMTTLLFNDYALTGAWDHAVSLAGLNNLRWTGTDYKVDQAYVGVSISTVSGFSSIHFMKVEGNQNIASNRFSTKELAVVAKKEINPTLTKQLNQAKATLANAETSLKNARAMGSNSPAAQKILQNALLDLQVSLNDLKAAKFDLETSKKNLNNQKVSQEKLKESSTLRLEKAQASLTKLHQGILAQNKVLQGLKKDLSLAEKNFNSAQSAFALAQKRLVSQKAELANIENAPALLAMTKERLKKAEVDVSVKQAALIVQELQLDELKAKNDKAQERKSELVAAFKVFVPKVEFDTPDQGLVQENSDKNVILSKDTASHSTDRQSHGLDQTENQYELDTVDSEVPGQKLAVHPIKDEGKVEIETPKRTLHLQGDLEGLTADQELEYAVAAQTPAYLAAKSSQSQSDSELSEVASTSTDSTTLSTESNKGDSSSQPAVLAAGLVAGVGLLGLSAITSRKARNKK